jgi:hypothetical protein
VGSQHKNRDEIASQRFFCLQQIKVVSMEEPLTDINGLALVPGPIAIEQPLYSFQVYDPIIGYPPEEIAAALLSIPGMRRANSGKIATGKWKARWKQEDRYLELDFTLMEPDEGVVWGGSHLQGRCRKSDVVNIWLALREQFEGVWLHDAKCRLWTPESFAQWKPAE